MEILPEVDRRLALRDLRARLERTDKEKGARLIALQIRLANMTGDEALVRETEDLARIMGFSTW